MNTFTEARVVKPSSSSLHSDAQHQSVGVAVRPVALIKSSTITGSLFKIPKLKLRSPRETGEIGPLDILAGVVVKLKTLFT